MKAKIGVFGFLCGCGAFGALFVADSVPPEFKSAVWIVAGFLMLIGVVCMLIGFGH